MDKADVVATVGTFDGVHLGHQSLLRELRRLAQERGERSMVVTFSPMPLQVLQPEVLPLCLSTTQERIELIKALGIDEVVILNFDTALSKLSAREFLLLLRDKYRIATVLLGYDHRFGSDTGLPLEAYEALGKSLAIDVVRTTSFDLEDKPVSSRTIRQCLLRGDISTANKLLGRAYSLSGQVVGGNRVGRTLGYPTANIQVNETNKLIPLDGVYAVKVVLNPCACREREHAYCGMLSVGNRPTLSDGLEQTIEVHLLDFSKQIYAEHVRVDFCHYIRENRKFASARDLSEQIALDERIIRAYFEQQSNNY